MARSATEDPVEKFRFQLTILHELSLADVLSVASGNSNWGSVKNAAASSLMGGIPLEGFSPTAGFSEIVMPKVTIGEISYRENVHGLAGIKVPALVKYENIVLRRGVNTDRSLYSWYSEVNDDSSTLNMYVKSLSSFSVIPIQSTTCRKDIVISVLDRSGTPFKHWFVFEAFPVAYKGGDDLAASADSKLVEELTISYETFLEVTGSSLTEAVSNLNELIKIGGNKSLIASLL
jgi:phage tail-like protein